VVYLWRFAKVYPPWRVGAFLQILSYGFAQDFICKANFALLHYYWLIKSVHAIKRANHFQH
jgi:hypothetical protein